MGLDCSHGAFNGSYGAFNSLRRFVCAAAGGSYPPHFIYGPEGRIEDVRTDLPECRFHCGPGYTRSEWPGLFEFLDHSDCEGEISPERCVLVANDLEKLLPNMESLSWKSYGHILYYDGFVATVKRFIDGCRLAAKRNEPLEFR